MAVIIFDFDGTIADSLELVIDIFKKLTGETKTLTKDEFDALRRLPAQKVMKALGVPVWRAPFLVRKGRSSMHTRLDEIEIFSSLPDVLKTLHGRGHTLRIVTSNSPTNVHDFLEKHGVREYFTDIHGDVGLFSKAKVLKSIVKQEHLSQGEVYYVGDEARDIVASKKAGLKIVSVSWGYNHGDLLRDMEPYALVDKPTDLLEIFS